MIVKLRRVWYIFQSRNKEFYRDRAAFGWNFVFPFLIVLGFGLIFGGKTYTQYKVGVFPGESRVVDSRNLELPEAFTKMRYIKFLGFPDKKTGMEKLSHHRIDFLVKTGDPPYQYWISDSSPKGYLVEKMFLSALSSDAAMKKAARKEIKTREIRYLDWLFPGILAMNMMFSALWGVGYVIVRYRKNGVLKRLKATPLTAFEYCSAQLFSRILVLMFVLAIVWVGCDLIFDFVNRGSYIDLFVVFLVGSISMTSMGLVVASRGISEEFTSGIINFISWPMMFLSEVWFSLEGSPEWVIQFSRVLPLTHLLSAVRKIMNDGAQLVDVGNEIGILSVMAVLFLAISAAMFSWNK